jgi:uncharacterized protein (TIGR00725 family)
MKRKIKIGVMGGAVCDEETAQAAEEVGRQIAQAGAVLICGGRGGVMEAACRGAQQMGGLTVGILPEVSAATANPYVEVAMPTGLGHARNVINVYASDAIIAIRGEYGTLSEIAIALKVGVPVIGLDTWIISTGRAEFVDPLHRARTPEDAVKLALALAAQNH